MNKLFSAIFMVMVVCGSAVADFTYSETETVTVVERIYEAPIAQPAPKPTSRFVSSRDVVAARPCDKRAGNPVRVKTHSEVIDHYQVYQPITVYQPMGRQVERRIVLAKPCGKCF